MSRPKPKLATGAEIGLSSYDFPDWMMPRGKRMAESYIADLGVKNARRIRAGKEPIDEIQNLTEWIEKTRDPEARAYAQRELKKMRCRRTSRLTAKIKPASKLPPGNQSRVAVSAARPSGVVPCTREDQCHELFRLLSLESPDQPKP